MAAADFIVSRLKFLDEAGSNLALARLYGRAAPGERVAEGVPQNYRENVTMLAAIGLDGLQAPMTVNGAMLGRKHGDGCALAFRSVAARQ